MYFPKMLSLILLSIIHSPPKATAAPAPAGSSNITSSGGPGTPAAAAAVSRCEYRYRIDMTIVDDEPFPFADEISHPGHIGTWIWYYRNT